MTLKSKGSKRRGAGSPSKLTDDEAITFATLHGARFDVQPSGFVYMEGEGVHPVEGHRVDLGNTMGTQSLAEMARSYCEFYKLGLDT